VDAAFIGHPLADAIPLHPERAAARAALGEPGDAPLLALLPGSRLGEIRRMLPDFAEAARRLATDVPGLRVLVPAANAQCRAAIDEILGDAPAFRVVDGQAQRIMVASDAVLLASGTAALEAMLCKRAMVVGHRIAPLTYRIVRSLGLLKSAHVSLPNVLAGEALVPELLQEHCTPANLHAALLRWFRDPAAVAALQPRFLAIHRTLRRDASARAADAVAELAARP
jgi:lipid-A-disaccharide synthase